MIKLAIVDDHKIFRQGLINIIRHFSGVDVLFEAENGQELFDILKSTTDKPEIILMDIKMPVMDGIEATKKIKLLYPQIKIIILSMQDDERYIIHLIKLGANGYLLKNCEPKEVEESIKYVSSDDFYFNSFVSKVLSKGLNIVNETSPTYNFKLLFSEKEIKVLKYICQENTAAEIALKLAISVRTVEGYKRSLLTQTNSKSTAGLVIFALKHDFFELDY